jgi:signal transduction histidine kinase
MCPTNCVHLWRDCASPWRWRNGPILKNGKNSGRLTRECDRLEALISEILVLARVDADNASAEAVDLNALLGTLQKDAQLGSPEQSVRLNAEPQLNLTGWPTMIERAVDNLLRNAQRFNPVGQAIEMQATRQGERIVVSVRDHGPGVQAEHLSSWANRFTGRRGKRRRDMAWAWQLPGGRRSGMAGV